MKVVICAGPSTTGKTSVLRHTIRRLKKSGALPSYLKIDVLYAEEQGIMEREFAIPAKTVYSGELCPDHCNVMVLGDAIEWAAGRKSDILFVETAGLCLRCSPYIEGSLGVVVLEATSGMNLPRKIGPMLTLADIAVVTKIDLVSQAEREVFRARIEESARGIRVVETDALYGTGIDRLVKAVEESKEMEYPLFLRGNPPMGTCTICVGKKEIGWKQHFGVVRPLEGEIFYRGE